MMRHYRIDPFFSRLFIVVGVGIVLYLMYQLSAVILPFVIAFVLSYLLNPTVSYLQDKLTMSRWLSILLVYFSIILMMGLVLWWLIPLIWEQAQSLWQSIPTMIDYYNQQVRQWIIAYTPINPPMIKINDMSASLLEYLKENYHITDARSIFGKLFLSGMSIVNVAGVVVLIPILMFYFLYNWQGRLSGWKQAIPKPYVKKVSQIVDESDHALMAFVKGQLLVMFLLGAVYAIQLQLIGLNVGLIIGMVAGIASFVPYLGFGIGIISALIAGFFQFGLDWVHLVLIFGAFMVGQAVEGYVLQPLLLGDKIGLSPLWVMFVVLAGASLMGIVGMLIALPVAAVINVICRHCYQSYLQSEFYHGNQSQN